MADVTVKGIDDFEAIYGGAFFRVRAGLGVTSFGMQVIRMPANVEYYPEHDHGHDGQEEVYYVIEGSLTLEADDTDFHVARGSFARVGPNQRRKLLPGDQGAVILAVGGIPGAVYVAPEITNEGAPDPLASK